MLKLLGVHWGQFSERWEVKQNEVSSSSEEGWTPTSIIREGEYVKGLSGMTCVCPSAAIMEVLTLPSLDKLRKKQERRWAEKLSSE